ncbi:hypothetical protein F5Y04DRAFT_288355 [Hypomontagnella monticulosa]|nr:hypothetical protein F5Y04DRAFT_288355 [Hypomontagnella monticulosa]
MASHTPIQNFFKRASTGLARIDGFVANAGIMLDVWSTIKDVETSITINVINTLFLGAFIMPKLVENGRKFGMHPTLIFIVSVFGYTAKAELDKNREGSIFSGLNDEKRSNMSQRTHRCDDHDGRARAVLDRLGSGRRPLHEAIRAMMALTAEAGSRTILHGLVVGLDGHGKLLSGCKIKE